MLLGNLFCMFGQVAQKATSSPEVTGYCTTYLSGGSFDVNSLSITGTNLNFTGPGATSTTSDGSYYVVLSPTSPNNTCMLTPGQTYSIIINTVNSDKVSMWIDYNQNGTFETTEWVQISTMTSSGSNSTATFTVPTTALIGQTGMRIRTRSYSNSNTSSDACTNFGSGCTLDFTVNIGSSTPAKPVANFTSISTIGTPGSPIQFNDLTTGIPTSWKWTFTGGTPSTSLAQNPSVTYNTSGKYDVKLVATNALGADSIIKTSYVTVTNAITIPISGSQSISTCDATIYDNGGTSTYTTYADGNLIIYPATAGKAVRLDFSSFSLNSNDYLYIYNGTSTNATLLATYSGTTLPNSVTATNLTGALTLRLVTSYNTNTGFVAKASCADLILQTVSAVSWSNSIDNNRNSYSQSKILNYSIKNEALTSSNVYAKIYSKPSTSTSYSLLSTSPSVSIGATSTFSQMCLVSGLNTKDIYDFKIELYNSSNTLLNTYDPTNNSLLGGLSFESVSDDALADYPVTSLGGNGFDMTAVSITGTTLNNTSTRPTAASGNYYVNWAASGSKTCTLTTGTNYTLNVTTNGSYNISLWIDYNQDKVFQANEWTQVATSTSYGTVNSVVFKIPNTALSGDTRMRIRTNYSWYSNTSTDATSTFYYGSTEDYTITVQAQTQSIPKTDFAASETNICLGSTVQFTDNSTGVPATWKWVFDGGSPSTSTSQNPSVTYNTVGVYPVKLVISNSLGRDSLVKTNYITVTNTVNVPASGSKSITACGVTIYDNGGTSNYANNSDGTLTIYPSTAKSAVRLQFSQFVTESWDYLYVYNGTSTSASQIGIYYGTTIPADIVASNASGALTLRFYSDGSSNYSGFVAQASCVPLYSQYLKNVSWTNVVDNNYNGYAQSKVLNYTVQNDKPAAASVYTKLYCNYNSKADSLIATSSLFSIAASSASGVKTCSVSGLNIQNNYNFKIELYNQADSLLSTYNSSAFSTLGSQKFESAADDGAPTYCTGNLGGGGFVLTGVAIKNTTLNNTATRTAIRTVDGSYYTDFQKSGSNTCSLNPGQTYTVSVTAASYYQIGMWIDFNHDSSFQSSEYTQVASYTTSSTTPSEVSFVVPTTAVSGDTKLRIRTLYNSSTTMGGTDACSYFNSGCTEDYTITIAAVNNAAPVPAFVASPTNCSIGSQVQFTDLSTNIPTGWKWTFTGGTPATSTSQNPTVVYANPGTYDVKLVARNAYGADSIVKSSYITITNSVMVPTTGSTSVTACGFTLYDNGGASNYANASNGSLTIYPSIAGQSVQLQFSEFSSESCDYLYVYDGTSTSATLIGSYSGSSIPSTITANNSTGALTLRFYSDGSVVYSGFTAQASCVTLPNFTIASAAWTNAIDNNYNGYYQSKTLNLVVRNNTSAKTSTYAKIYYKLTSATSYTLYGETTPIAINANSVSETFIYNVTNLPARGYYDLKIELYDASNTLISTYTSVDDSDLKSQGFEPVSSDGVGYYCTSNLGGSASDITAVSATGTTLNNTTTRSSNSPYTSYSASGVYTGSLTWNAINTINVTTSNNDIVSMWIDYDHNSTFDASEWTLVSAASNSRAVSASFYIPTTALTGQTRMRIRTRSAGTSNFSTDACTNFSSGCTEDYTITIDKLNGVDDVNSTLLKLYPNPVSDKLKIAIPGFYKGTLQVMDVVGRKVISTEVSGEEFEQNVSDLKTGIYFIQIKSENGQTFNKEFMVRH